MGSQLSKRIDHADKTGVLALQDVKLQKIPVDVQRLAPKLRSFSLNKNVIKSLPVWLGLFENLKTLTIDNNRLENLPTELASLKKLETFSANFNRLSSIPGCIASWKNLKSLSLASNQITDINPSLYTLKKLQTLFLADNKITEIPSGIGQLNAMEIDLNGNQVQRIPDDLKDDKKLKVLRLEQNCLVLDAISPVFLKESPVSLLCLDGNPLTAKQFQDIDGYSDYEKRYTAVKKKAG